MRDLEQAAKSRRLSVDRGMVTVELAIGILSLAIVTVMLGFIIGAITLHGACADVATQVARQLARDDVEQADAAKTRAPQGARIEVQQDGDLVSVEVSAEARFGRLWAIPVTAKAVSNHE